MGIHEGPEVDVSGMILKRFKGLLIPPAAYYSYEPLPEIWQKILGKPEVTDAVEHTPDMDAFARLPICKRASEFEGSKSLAQLRPRTGSQNRLAVSQQESATNSRRFSRLRHSEAQTDELEAMEAEVLEADIADLSKSDHLRPNYASQDASLVPGGSFKKHWRSQVAGSEKEDQSRTDAGDEQRPHESEGRFHSTLADEQLLLELASFNAELNREVGQVLNEGRADGK